MLFHCIFQSVLLQICFKLEEEISNKKREKLAKKGIVVRTKEEKRQLRRQKEKERKSKKKRKRGGAGRDDEFETAKDVVKPGILFSADSLCREPLLKGKT